MSAAARVAILDDYQGIALSMADWHSLGPGVEIETFREAIDAGALAARLRGFDIIVAMRERTAFPRTLIEQLSSLKLLVTTGQRNHAIDVQAAAERGIPVCGTSTLTTPAVELTWALILALARKLPQESAAMRAGAWQTTIGNGLHGKILGVLGLGRLGAQVARIGQAFGMDIIAWSQNLTADEASAAGARLVDKQTLFREADFVTIHLVLGPRSKQLVGATELMSMKQSAYLVNTARGPIVDEAALIAALQTGIIAGAGLDVYDEEPLPAGHPLRALGNATLTPHLGYVTEENYREMYGQAVEDISAFLSGHPVRVLAPDRG